MKRDLERHLEDITTPFGLKPDFDMHGTHSTPIPRSHSKWLEILDDPNTYGREYDYQIFDDNYFSPACEAAQEWLRYKIGDTQHWITNLDGFTGAVIDGPIDGLLRAANRDGLISYDERMALEQEGERG